MFILSPHHFSRSVFLSVVAVVFFLFHVPLSYATTCTWTGATNSTWATTTNWSGCSGVAPTSGDDVVIDGSYTNAPTLDLSGGTTTLLSLSLGSTSASVLTVSNSGTTTKGLAVTNDVVIGGSGTLTHTANSSSQTHSLYIEIGGNMTIRSGGKIDVTGKGYAGGTTGVGKGPGGGARDGNGASGVSGAGAGYAGAGGNGSYPGILGGYKLWFNNCTS